MQARAFAEDDWARGGDVKIGVRQEHPNGRAEILMWQVSAKRVDDSAALPDDAYLRLPTETARALYEALSRHFGGNVVDATTLRKDYDAERKRVDLFIAHLTETK